MSEVVPFGRWPSPLGVDDVAAGRLSRSGLASDGDRLFWLESRPTEGGRQVVVAAAPGGAAEVVSPAGVSVRSRVHEYGGGAFCLVPVAGGATHLAYVDQADQRIWCLRLGAGPGGRSAGGAPAGGARPLTPAMGTGGRHGDLRPAGRGWMTAVRERPGEGPAVVHEVVAVRVDGPDDEAGPAEPVVVLGGRDFFAAPTVDGAGRRMAWIAWDHPDMPWTASELWVGELAGAGTGARGDGASMELTAAERLAGGRPPRGTPVSVGQPHWCEDGGLVFVSDEGGWWQPWRWDPGGDVRRLSAEEAEFHGPDWSLGQSTMAEVAPGHLLVRRQRDGRDGLCRLAVEGGACTAVAQPCVSVTAVCVHRGSGAWLGATPYAPATVWWEPVPGAAPEPVVPPAALLDVGSVSVAEPFDCAGDDGGAVHGLYYPPTLQRVSGPAGQAPPLVIQCHGGPTGSAGAAFDPVVQLLTSRGFAVAAVDYRGSSGYGRAYRDALAGRWGLVDVDDCAAAARHLVAEGRADGRRLALRGSSAGGFTALLALVRSDLFAGAVSWYGVTDLLALAASTHDFESRYNDWLVGPLPECTEEYRRRSPVHRVEEFHGAALLLQGLDDPVVPPAQSASMAAALRARGVRCDYVTFEGESHGFRRSETLRRALQAELDFYHQVLRLG